MSTSASTSATPAASLAVPTGGVKPQNKWVRVGGLLLFAYLGIPCVAFAPALGSKSFDGVLTIVILGSLLALTPFNKLTLASIVLGVVGVTAGAPDVFTWFARMDDEALGWLSVLARGGSAMLALFQLVYQRVEPGDSRAVWDAFLARLFGFPGWVFLLLACLITLTFWSEVRHAECGRQDSDGRPVATTWSECGQVPNLLGLEGGHAESRTRL